MTDTEDLVHSLETHRNQLNEVEALIVACDGEDEALLSLRTSLRELVTLTEASVEQQRQSKLAASTVVSDAQPTSAAAADNCSANADGNDEEMRRFQEEILALERAPTTAELDDGGALCDGGDSTGAEADLQHSLQCLVGQQCTAPFTHAWGHMQYHSAIVEAVEHARLTDDASTLDLTVRVLFSHPTHSSMKPCPHYLQDRCQFADDCRYSHGHQVALSQLRESPCELTAGVCAGRDVLVRRRDDPELWRRVRVQHVQSDTGHVTVRDTWPVARGTTRETDEATLTLPLDHVAPVLPDSQHRHGDESSECSSSGDNSCDDSAEDEMVHVTGRTVSPSHSIDQTAASLPGPAVTDTLCTHTLAAWEQHTKGVGSRLLRSMGYVMGGGLGARGDGRVSPVQVTVCPPGVSLDYCKRADCVGRTPRRPPVHRPSHRRHDNRYRHHRSPAVFDVINKLTGSDNQRSMASADGEERDSGDDAGSLQQLSASQLNMRRFRVGETIATLRRHLRRLEATSARQSGAGGDAARATIGRQRAAVSRLIRRDQQLQAELSARKRRLDVF